MSRKFKLGTYSYPIQRYNVVSTSTYTCTVCTILESIFTPYLLWVHEYIRYVLVCTSSTGIPKRNAEEYGDMSWDLMYYSERGSLSTTTS